MKKKLLSSLLLLTAFTLGACGNTSGDAESESSTSAAATSEVAESESTTDYGIDKDTIIVGISGNYEPFTFEENGENVGYSMDVWKEFESRTGIAVEYETTDFSGLLGLLESGRADVIDAQMSPTPEREEKFAFTEPVTYYGAVVAIAEDNDKIKTIDDLKGTVIGVGAGNNMQKTVDEMYAPGDITWEVYQSATLDNMLKDVELGRIDGMLAQNIQATMAIEGSGAKAKLTPIFDEQVGTLVVNKADQQTLDGLNEFIAEIKEDGTLQEISDKWVGMDITKSQN